MKRSKMIERKTFNYLNTANANLLPDTELTEVANAAQISVYLLCASVFVA